MKLLTLLSFLTIGATVEGYRYHISDELMTKDQGNKYCHKLKSWLAVMDEENIEKAWTKLYDKMGERGSNELLFDRRPGHADKRGMMLVFLSATQYKLVPAKSHEKGYVLCQGKIADRISTKKSKKHRKDKKKARKHRKDKKKAKKHHDKGTQFFH